MQPKQKTRKRGHDLNGSILRRARERATQNRDSSNGPFQGLRSAKRRVKEITSRRRCDLLCKTGQTQPEDGRRRETTVSRPTLADNDAIPIWWKKKTEIGDTTGLQPIYENEES